MWTDNTTNTLIIHVNFSTKNDAALTFVSYNKNDLYIVTVVIYSTRDAAANLGFKILDI